MESERTRPEHSDNLKNIKDYVLDSKYAYYCKFKQYLVFTIALRKSVSVLKSLKT